MSAATQIPKFTIFPDSCCLFTSKETQIVNYSFTKLFAELKSKCDLRLAIPYIVFGELLSQKVFRCEQFLEKATSNIRQIAKLTDSDLLTPPTIQELRNRLEKRFGDWMADLGAVVVHVPKDIDWPALIENAVWRRPPFSPRTESEPSIEKGFKDALILETLLAFQKDAQDREIVFVCADALLSESATSRLTKQPGFRVVKSLEEFGSYVDLLLNQRSEEFSQAILSKIGSVFYSEHDPNCLWFKFGVLEQVHKAMGFRLSGFFSDIYERATSYLQHGYARLETVPTPLEPVTEEFPLIGETTFVSAGNDGFYHWQTQAELRQIFAPKQVSTPAGFYYAPGDRLRKLVANVKWKCRISAEREFTDAMVENVEFVSEKFETPGYVDYIQLRHPRWISLENYAEAGTQQFPKATFRTEGKVTQIRRANGEDEITCTFLTPPGFQGGVTLEGKLTEPIPALPPPLVERTMTAYRVRPHGFKVGDRVEINDSSDLSKRFKTQSA